MCAGLSVLAGPRDESFPQTKRGSQGLPTLSLYLEGLLVGGLCPLSCAWAASVPAAPAGRGAGRAGEGAALSVARGAGGGLLAAADQGRAVSSPRLASDVHSVPGSVGEDSGQRGTSPRRWAQGQGGPSVRQPLGRLGVGGEAPRWRWCQGRRVPRSDCQISSLTHALDVCSFPDVSQGRGAPSWRAGAGGGAQRCCLPRGGGSRCGGSPLTAAEPHAGHSRCQRSYRAGRTHDAGRPPELRAGRPQRS